MKTSVRRANLRDLDVLKDFMLDEAREAEGINIKPETARKGIQSALKNETLARYWIAEEEGAGPVASISILREWSDWNAGYYWWIQSFYVVPQKRGLGLTSLLLQTVIETAVREKALDIRLYVHQGNKRAVRAYEKIGFRETRYKIMSLEI
jgi:GNAT superfamily N-acetyltransferase